MATKLSTAFLTNWVKPALTIVLLLPAAWLLVEVYGYVATGFSLALGANPPEYVNRETGEWALRTLWLCLAITPLSKVINSQKPILFRRRIGLIAYFYAFLHLSSYIVLDQFFDWSAIWDDISKRVFITLGMTAFLLLTALAVTSNATSIRRLTAKNWRRLHKLVYPAAILVSIHFIMMRKGFQLEPLVYAGILGVLFALRLIPKRKKRKTA